MRQTSNIHLFSHSSWSVSVTSKNFPWDMSLSLLVYWNFKNILSSHKSVIVIQSLSSLGTLQRLHWILEGAGNDYSKHEQLFAHKMHPIIWIVVVHWAHKLSMHGLIVRMRNYWRWFQNLLRYEISATKRSKVCKVLETLNVSSFQFLSLRRCLKSECPCLKKKQPLQPHQNPNMQPTNTLEHTLIILKCMVDGHVFMNSISLNKKIHL